MGAALDAARWSVGDYMDAGHLRRKIATDARAAVGPCKTPPSVAPPPRLLPTPPALGISLATHAPLAPLPGTTHTRCDCSAEPHHPSLLPLLASVNGRNVGPNDEPSEGKVHLIWQ